MLGLIESVGLLTPLINLGATGVMLIMVWRHLLKKDKKSYDMIEAQNKERREMYESHSELIREVTTALVDKNNTDDKMSVALMKLADELREIRDMLKKDSNHEEA